MLDLAERSPLWPVVIRKLWTALSEPVLYMGDPRARRRGWGGAGGNGQQKEKSQTNIAPSSPPTQPMKQEKCLIPKYLLPGHDQLEKTDWALLLGLCISH